MGSALAEVRGAPARVLEALCACVGVAYRPQPAVAALRGDTAGCRRGGLQQGGCGDRHCSRHFLRRRRLSAARDVTASGHWLDAQGCVGRVGLGCAREPRTDEGDGTHRFLS